MKKLLLWVCAVMAALSVHSQDNLRLMTYNVRNAKGMDNVRNCQRIANVINNAQPDVVAVQELDSVTGRSGGQYVLAEIAGRTQMHASYAPAIDYDGGKYGIGILSREEPLNVRTCALPGREERRTFIVAEFEDYLFACTHLSLNSEDRMSSLELIRGMAADARKPFFLAGDFNATPESDFMQALQKDFRLLNNVKQFTAPASTPKETIDYIASWKPTARGYATLAARVLDEPVASDHRPIIVDIRMARKAEALFRTRPYLQNPVGGGITVMWETTIPAYSWVEFGTDTTNLSRARLLVDGQAEFNESIHKIRLEGLQPGTTYYYRVCSQEILLYKAYQKVMGHIAKSGFHSFTLPEPDAESFTAVIFNDLHQRAETFKALCRQIEGVDYDFVVFNGDCVDDPVNHDQATHFVSLLTEAVHGDRIPTFFLRGNHEIRNAYSVGLRKHYDYVGGKTYCAFNWGDTRIVMLDCGEDKPDDTPVYYDLNDFTRLRQDQADFLRTELSSKAFKKADKRILIHHIPIYGYLGENLCEPLWKPILEKAPFDVAIHGHTHRHAFYPKGSEQGNPYPVFIGGGYKLEGATVTIVEKRKDTLRVKMIGASGQVIAEVETK